MICGRVEPAPGLARFATTRTGASQAHCLIPFAVFIPGPIRLVNVLRFARGLRQIRTALALDPPPAGDGAEGAP